MIQPFLVFSDWAILILRVVLGAILMAHGWPKIKDLNSATKVFKSMGFGPARFWATIVAILEFFGGFALLVGFFTQITALLFVIEFIVIMLKLKIRQGFVNGYEFDLLILASSLLLATIGGGFYGLDNYFGFVLY